MPNTVINHRLNETAPSKLLGNYNKLGEKSSETPVYRLLKAQHKYTRAIQSRRKDNDNSVSMSYCRTFGVTPFNIDMPSSVRAALKITGTYSITGALNKCNNPSCIACSIERSHEEYEDLSLVMDHLIGREGYSCVFLTTTHSTLLDPEVNYKIQSQTISKIKNCIRDFQKSKHSIEGSREILFRSIIETTFSRSHRLVQGEWRLTQHTHAHSLLYFPPEYKDQIDRVLSSIRKSYNSLLRRFNTTAILDQGDGSKGFYIRRYEALTDELRDNLSRYVSNKMSLQNKLSMENTHTRLKTGKGFNLYELLDHCFKTKSKDHILQYQSYIKMRTGKHAFRCSKALKQLIEDLKIYKEEMERELIKEELTDETKRLSEDYINNLIDMKISEKKEIERVSDIIREINIHPSLFNVMISVPDSNSYKINEILYYVLRNEDQYPQFETFIEKYSLELYNFDYVHYSDDNKTLWKKKKELENIFLDILKTIDYDMVVTSNSTFIANGMYNTK